MEESKPRRQRSPEQPLGIDPGGREDNLLEWLYALRDRQRQHLGKGAWLIRGDEVPWESNRQGRMQWFLHPALEDTAIRSLMFFRQEIPPGSRSGAQKTPGGQIIYIIQGRGYTTLDGERHYWEAEDVVNIPIRADGVTVQHFNTEDDEAVVMVCADLNLADLVGVDRGSALEQVEDAPR